MPGYFNSPEGDLERIFVDDYAMIDQYAKTGSLWNWGKNYPGILGDNTTANKSSPVQTISAGQSWSSVSCGFEHTAAIKTDGTLWLWGSGSGGRLGDNTTTSKSSPVQTISQGTNWKLVSCGRQSTLAVKTDGSLWGWGNNYSGTLGTGDSFSKSSPVQTISQGTNWKLVSCGNYSTAAIKTDGSLWLWGANNYFQLGTGNSTQRSSPVQTAVGGTDWKTVSCGGTHVAGIKTDGTLWLWGSNVNGELGDGTRTQVSIPTQTVGSTSKWKSVSLNKFSFGTAAIKTDGTLWTWGNNSFGQLGNNNVSHQSSPVQTVSGGANWKSISASDHMVAVKTDGTLWTWGYNNGGQLGNNTTNNTSSPIQTISGGTNWKLVSAGRYHTAAIHFYDAGNLYPNA